MAFLVLGMVTACGPTVTRSAGEPFDPFEEENRRVHDFNRSLDGSVIRKVAIGYSEFMPDDIEDRITLFSDNLSLAGSVVNSILQGRMDNAAQDTARFAVNTVWGLGGLFDTASELGMPPAVDADFGQTLHVWGFKQGPYLEIPFLGPSTSRDAVGKFVDLWTNPFSYVTQTPESYYSPTAKVSSAITKRGRYSDTVDSILYDSADSYAQARTLYLQNRNYELGKTGDSSYVDPYDDPYGDPYDE